MFNCERCGKTSQPGQPSYRKVVETREKTYPYRSHANRGGPFDIRDDPGGTGTEIVREITICEECHA